MGFREQWDRWGWIVPAAVIVFFSVRMLFGREAFCAVGDGEHCAREWVSALSGYVAAIAAAITIRSLFKQADAAQKQTEFMIGDAAPTIDVVQHKHAPQQVVLRIRNWNRRSMIVRELRLLGADYVRMLHIRFDKGSEDGDMFGYAPSYTFDPALMIEGWVKRDDAPPLVKFGLHAMRGQDDYLDEEWRYVKIEIIYEMVGTSVICSQKAHVHLVASNIRADLLKSLAGVELEL